jgi:homoserine O-acetyltransferase/O-succinyltransferase
MLEPSYQTFKNFKFESGAVIPELEVEYATFGKAVRDPEGCITNGILFLHGSSGDYSSIRRYKDMLGPGLVFDTDKFFIISTTALGSPGTSAPSTSSLKADFPKYSIGDMVNVQLLLLKEHLKIKHLKGVVGTSMGGFQALKWAVNYPDFMDFTLPVVTSSRVQGRNLAIFQLVNSLIKTHPQYENGRYQENPEDALENANKLLFLFAFSPPYYNQEFPGKKLLLALEEQGLEGRKLDANDEVWRNEAAISYDIHEDLSKIRSKVLVIGIRGDQYFPPEIDAIPLSRAIKNAEIFVYDSELGHLGINEIKKAEVALKKFLSDI